MHENVPLNEQKATLKLAVGCSLSIDLALAKKLAIEYGIDK